MHLTPQQQQLVNLLADGSWHCTVAEEFMKDDRSRISELRKMGFVFDESGKICDRHNHQSKLKLRRLISFPDGFLTQETAPSKEIKPKVIHPVAKAFLERDRTEWNPKWDNSDLIKASKLF